MDASCQNNFQLADRRYAAPECFREVGFFDAPNVEPRNPGDHPQQVLSNLHRHVGSSTRRTVENCGRPSYFHPYGEGPLQRSNLSSVPPAASAFNGTAHVLLSSLSVLQQKARQLEAFVQEGRHDQPGIVSSILHELIVTAAWVLASVQGRGIGNPTSVDSVVDLEGIDNINIQGEPGGLGLALGFGKPDGINQGIQAEATNSNNSSRCQLSQDAERKIEAMDERAYEIVEMNEDDILAEHTHFCEICGKGFRRDANVRMHMRAHGNEYKTHQALMSKPSVPEKLCRDSPSRYSCPFERCRRNKNHRKFKPLKSIASLRNHYKRSHCPKMYTCNKCNKQFSVVGDLKTHGKNCGHNRWQCSCGTTFTRKDKLFGHVALFEGHRPVLPLGEAAAKPEEEKGIPGNGHRPNFFEGDPAGLVNNTQSYGNSSGDDMLFNAGSSHQNHIDGRFCESDVFWTGFSG